MVIVVTEEEKRAKRAAYMRDWKRRNSEKVNAINRKVKAKNPALYREINRRSFAKRCAEVPGFSATKARKDRERRTPEQRAAAAEYQKRWFAANPDYSREKQAEEYAVCPQKSMVSNAKARAARLGVPFDLDWRDIEIPAICPVLGIKITLGNKGFCDNSPSLDRLIPSLGYVASNVRVISYRANAIKRDATLEELRAIAAYVERELG